MAFPLVTSLAVAGVAAPALLVTLAVVTGFLSHEPLLVLLGRRGARAARDNRSRAALWLAVTVATTAAAGFAGLWLMPPAVRWSLMLPLAPAAILAATIPGKRDKGAVAEVTVALVFSFAAVPVCLAAGATTRTAFVVASVFALVFVAGTLAVRSLVLAARGGGTRERLTRAASRYCC
jgi:YwiC-like protein